MKPTITIIMATYNRAQYIVESVKSIQAQTFDSWECLIIDDGGTDNTSEVLTPILEKDTRFSYLKRTDKYKKGLPGSRNYGLDLAQGDYIIFFDDDDIVHPQNLEICVSELSKKDRYFCRYIRNVFHGDFDYNFEYSKNYKSFNINEKDIYRIIRNELGFNSCAVMWKKDCFKNNRFVETLMYAEEWELYTRIISNGINGVSINKTLFYGRKHQNSNTGEFYKLNPVRLKSYVEAIILVIENLKEKKLINNEIIHYFIQISLNFKDYNLFEKIMEVLNLSPYKAFKWRFFHLVLPLRLFIYKAYKKIKN